MAGSNTSCAYSMVSLSEANSISFFASAMERELYARSLHSAISSLQHSIPRLEVLQMWSLLAWHRKPLQRAMMKAP